MGFGELRLANRPRNSFNFWFFCFPRSIIFSVIGRFVEANSVHLVFLLWSATNHRNFFKTLLTISGSSCFASRTLYNTIRHEQEGIPQFINDVVNARLSWCNFVTTVHVLMQTLSLSGAVFTTSRYRRWWQGARGFPLPEFFVGVLVRCLDCSQLFWWRDWVVRRLFW